MRLLYIVNSVFFVFLFRHLFGLFRFLDYLRSVTYRIHFSFSYSFHFFSWFPLFVFSSSFPLFSFMEYQVRSCPYYFTCHLCFPDSLVIFLIDIKINNKHNIIDIWILHPSLILNNQIFLLLNYWCNLIENKNYSYYNLDQLMV